VAEEGWCLPVKKDRRSLTVGQGKSVILIKFTWERYSSKKKARKRGEIMKATKKTKKGRLFTSAAQKKASSKGKIGTTVNRGRREGKLRDTQKSPLSQGGRGQSRRGSMGGLPQLKRAGHVHVLPGGARRRTPRKKRVL